MTRLHKLEKSMDKFFNESFPQIPSKTKKFFINYLPIISFVGGLLALYSAYNIWHWAHLNTYISNVAIVNGTNHIYTSNQLNLGIWLSIILLILSGILYITAYSQVKKQSKKGWDLIYYGLIVNLAYCLIISFTLYGSGGSLIVSLIGLAIGFYLLFQIRSAYLPHHKK